MEEIWLSLGDFTFNSDEMTKKWHVPDLTWSEGQSANQIELKVASNSSKNASGKFDFLELNKRLKKVKARQLRYSTTVLQS